MAYAALVSLEQTIHQILNHDRYSTSPQEQRLIKSVLEYIISFQAFLEDFPEKANNMEGQMRDAANAAEDIIEYFMLEQILSPQVRIKFEHELGEVNDKMDSIAIKAVEIKNSIIIEDGQLSESSIASSSSGVGKMDMVGFDDNLMEIKDRLIGTSSKLQFLSIVGMGGIGKTTLARNAYDDHLIKRHFQICAWVTVSQDYRARDILSSFLDSMKEFNPKQSEHRKESKGVEDMAERVYKILKGRRYLIVMDDIWSTKVLDDVRKLFPDDDNGSRIMLTTRLSEVATYAYSSIPPYKMCPMSYNQSWNLFQHKVFGHQNRDPPELVYIGQEIARNCGGLPLAIVVVAGVLSTVSKTPASWWKIARNIKTSIAKDEQLEKILLLSYNHLPHRLRPCLLYMGAFPEDYTIRVPELIRLWIAEGFLKHSNTSKSLEEGAEECLEDLVQRNLISVTGRKYDGRMETCNLHDMVRDTCIRLLEEENNLRHVRGKYLKEDPGCISMRSILSFYDFEVPLEPVRLLRVLHVHQFGEFYVRPRTWNISKLFHLRYLAFSCYQIPSDISNLQYLQTLVINVRISVELPPSIWRLRLLRHLIYRGRLPDPEGTASALESLQTLKEVNHEEYRAFLLARIPHLRKLGLYYNPFSFYGGRYLNEYLVCYRQLENLKISSDNALCEFDDAVFPVSLRKCTLRGWTLSQRFLKALGSLPNLEVLKLKTCLIDHSFRSSWVIGGGDFPQLKSLVIDNMLFTTLDAEDSSALPRLKRLQLHNCRCLKNISDHIGEVPTLELIDVKGCDRAVLDWAERMKEEQESFGNDTLRVTSLP